MNPKGESTRSFPAGNMNLHRPSQIREAVSSRSSLSIPVRRNLAENIAGVGKNLSAAAWSPFATYVMHLRMRVSSSCTCAGHTCTRVYRARRRSISYTGCGITPCSRRPQCILSSHSPFPITRPPNLYTADVSDCTLITNLSPNSRSRLRIRRISAAEISKTEGLLRD